MLKIFMFGLIFVNTVRISAQSNPYLDSLFRNSFKLYELQRLPNGMYRDSRVLQGLDYHPVSISNTGIGLISLCIADKMGWIENAEAQVLLTLQSVQGQHAVFSPDRNRNGFFRHFLDVITGEQFWNSEYSTIDTAILMCGALFCKKYFNSTEIDDYVDELWDSIDFETTIANSSNGQIFLSMNKDGSGIPNSLTSPYNEYMIVAWLAKNSTGDKNSESHILWNNYYESASNLPSSIYNGIPILTDRPDSFLSSFTHLFNYYLCHHYTISEDYLIAMENSQKADELWWTNVNNQPYEWGLGAGSAISNSYHADAINNNPDRIVSPQIVGGYLPINYNGKDDLIEMWKSSNGKYLLPNSIDEHVLWRYSVKTNDWRPNEFIGIDYSTMLFGLATLPEYLGIEFFRTHNDFFALSTHLNHQDKNELSTQIVPNPSDGRFSVEFERDWRKVRIVIFNSVGKKFHSEYFHFLDKLDIHLIGTPGVYFLNIQIDGEVEYFLKLLKI